MKTEKAEKFLGNLYDKTEYVIHIRNLNQALNYRLVFKNSYGVIISNQNVWLKSYIDVNKHLRKKQRMIFKKALLSR